MKSHKKDGQVIPVEVKAGNQSTVSLNRFIDEYRPDRAYKYISGNRGTSGVRQILPHYMVMFL